MNKPIICTLAKRNLFESENMNEIQQESHKISKINWKCCEETFKLRERRKQTENFMGGRRKFRTNFNYF